MIGVRLHLSMGKLNNGHRLGLQVSVDASNKQYSNDDAGSTIQREAPPHATSYNFEAIQDPATAMGVSSTETDVN
jgi:hypothetical protein